MRRFRRVREVVEHGRVPRVDSLCNAPAGQPDARYDVTRQSEPPGGPAAGRSPVSGAR